MIIHYLQHVPFENPANIVPWAKNRAHTLTGTHLYNYEQLPTMEQFDFLVIMGGPMNIYEETKYPWLVEEKRFIKEAIMHKKIVLGICLGAQLITAALGGKVTKNPEGEIGWLPIAFEQNPTKLPFLNVFPKSVFVFQWHNDTFNILGQDTIPIAGSKACENQAFVYSDHVVGFQFHLESTKTSINALLENCSDDLNQNGTYVQSVEEIQNLSDEYIQSANNLMDMFLDSLIAYHSEQR